MNKLCLIQDCNRQYHAKGFCVLHYKRWRRTGDPLINRRVRHGMWKSRIYAVWANMKWRCSNPGAEHYPSYGGRGITVCEHWQSFENFLTDMGEPPFAGASIDRIDNDGPYSPENCRWATVVEQANNTSQNVSLEINGQRYTVAQWATARNVSRRAIYERLRKGWDKEKAFLTPIRNKAAVTAR